MIEVSWAQLKEFVDDRGLLIQWLDMGTFYKLVAIDGPFSLTHTMSKDVTDTEDLDTFEATYKPAGNKPIRTYLADGREVQPIKSSSVNVLMARAEANIADGVANVKIKIPASRVLSGGFGSFANQATGDYVKISIEDDDNIFGYGAGFRLVDFSDADEDEENRGWYFTGSQQLEISPMIVNDPKDLSALAGTYLHLRGYKKDSSIDTLYCNIFWGYKIR